MSSEFELLLLSKERKRRRRKSLRRSIRRFTVTVPISALFAFGLYVASPTLIDRARSGATKSSLHPSVIVGGTAWGNAPNDAAKPGLIIGGLSGRVTHVRDGDTIEVRGVPVRFARLDCAEKGSVRGDAATRKMKALVSGESVTCRLTGERSYDRKIGSCRLNDGRDIAQVMVSSGVCSWWR